MPVMAAPFMFILDSFETACMELSILELFTTHQQGYNHTHIQSFIWKKPQSWARDNTAATTWPCFQAKKMVDIVLWLYSVWLLHLQIPRPKKNSGPWCSISLSSFCIGVVAKLNNCCVPSSAYWRNYNPFFDWTSKWKFFAVTFCCSVNTPNFL